MAVTQQIMEQYEKLYDDTIQFYLFKDEFFETASSINEQIFYHYEAMDEAYNVVHIQNQLFAYMGNYIEHKNSKLIGSSYEGVNGAS